MIVYLNAAAGMARNRGGMRGGAVGLSAVVGLGASLGLNLAMSKGEIRLRSGDYRDYPYLDYNLLNHEEDLRRYRDGVRMVVGLEDHPAMAAIIEKRVYPEDSDLGIRRGAELLDEAMGGDRPPRLLHRQDGT